MLYPIEPWAQRSIFYTYLFELQDLAQSYNSGQNNPVVIDIMDTDTDSMSHKFNKASEEIASLDNPDDTIMGIPKKYIDDKKSYPPLIFDRPQKVA